MIIINKNNLRKLLFFLVHLSYILNLYESVKYDVFLIMEEVMCGEIQF